MARRHLTDRSKIISSLRSGALPRRLAATAVATSLVGVGLPAAAALGGSGLAITPAIIEHPAASGAVGSVTVSNTTGQTLKIAVSARPWLQSATGQVVPDQRHVLPGVALSPASFTLTSGSTRQVSITLASVPAAGSLYGNVDVIGVPTTTARRGVTVDYRLIGSLRLDPATPSYGARAVSVSVGGNHLRGLISVAVRNTGNTVTPIGGSVTLRGAHGSATGTISPVRIIPGVTVNLPALRLHGSLPAGSYKLTSTLTSGPVTSHGTASVVLK